MYIGEGLVIKACVIGMTIGGLGINCFHGIPSYYSPRGPQKLGITVRLAVLLIG